ncbi:hypothetical protein ABZY58_11815 [Micromonospora tulbaghiae]|uniref:hypothetical protein n=1 Tax=Micromonospora tulbaghiae TaxID=479978 RepID=UPI0033B6E2FC
MASDSYPRPGYNSGIVTELLYERLVHAQAPDGLLGDPTDPALVFTDGVGTRMVRIRPNRLGLVRGFQYDSGPDEISFQLPANTSGATRYDLIVLRLNRATYRVQEAHIQGLPGGGPPSPVQQTDSGFWDLPVAQVTVPNNANLLGGGAVTPLAWYIGPDGNILCTDKTRPPHAKGRTAYEVNTKRWILSDGASKWTYVLDDSGVMSLPLLENFAAAENNLQRRNGQAILTLKVRRTNAGFAAATETRVASLPDGFTPTFPAQSAALYWSGGSAAGLRVTAAGVYVVTPAGVAVNQNRSVDGQVTWFTV